MVGRNPVLERIKQKIKVLEQQELPFKQVAFDVLQSYTKDKFIGNHAIFDRVLHELKLKYQKEINELETQQEKKQKFIQKKLF